MASTQHESPKALVKALAILEVIAEHRDGLSLAKLSQSMEIPKPTIHRLVQPLIEHRLLQATDEGYRLGAQCLVFGTRFIEAVDLRQEARDVLADLVSHSGETCHLGVMDGHRVVYIEKVESAHAVRMHSRVGSTNPVHSTGVGKAMLAHVSAELLDEIVTEGLEQRTPATLTEAGALWEDLARSRERGYAIDDIENEDGIRCVAAPVFDNGGSVVAGLSIAGPVHRVTRDRFAELGERVREAALELSKRIGYLGDLPVGGQGFGGKEKLGE